MLYLDIDMIDGLSSSNLPQGVRRHKPGSQSVEVEVSHSAAFTSEGSVRRCSKVEVPKSAIPQETFGFVGIWMFPKMVGFPNNHGFFLLKMINYGVFWGVPLFLETPIC